MGNKLWDTLLSYRRGQTRQDTLSGTEQTATVIDYEPVPHSSQPLSRLEAFTVEINGNKHTVAFTNLKPDLSERVLSQRVARGEHPVIVLHLDSKELFEAGTEENPRMIDYYDCRLVRWYTE